MSEKASKFSIKELNHKIEGEYARLEAFTKQNRIMEQFISDMKDKLQVADSKFDNINQIINREI